MIRTKSTSTHEYRSFVQIKLGLDKLGVALIVALVMLMSSGCAQQMQRPPDDPAKQAHRDPHAEPQAQPFPEHVAPPPAYGNKVVMAQSDQFNEL